jgi:hypothetical protein
LVQTWKRNHAGNRDVVNAALNFFRSQGFRYSLAPGEYKKNDLDEFLFRRRTGFCEHYAASFATLMRIAGIPARVVTGYLGGEYNELGHFFVVRQSDAHAWCEVWLTDGGPNMTGAWERVDPTSVIAPERLTLGLNSLLEKEALAGQAPVQNGVFKRILTRWPIITRARMAWQMLSYSWDVHVLSFDADAQDALVQSLGIGQRIPLSPLNLSMIGIVLLLIVYAAWNRFRTTPPIDRVRILYETFCDKLARLGVSRDLVEGPMDFSKRAGRLLPNNSKEIQNVMRDYIALRYSANTDSKLLNRFAVEVTMFGRERP